jgi:hypothetical protein
MWGLPLPCSSMVFGGKMHFMVYNGKVLNRFAWLLFQWYSKFSYCFIWVISCFGVYSIIWWFVYFYVHKQLNLGSYMLFSFHPKLIFFQNWNQEPTKNKIKNWTKGFIKFIGGYFKFQEKLELGSKVCFRSKNWLTFFSTFLKSLCYERC